MRDLIEAALRGHPSPSGRADYVEVRLEETRSSRLSFRGPELDDIGSFVSIGGCVRALVKGGWGFVSFNDVSDLRRWVEVAVAQAQLAARDDETVRLAPVEPVIDIVPAEVVKDPATVPLSQKKALLEDYNAILLAMPQITTTSVGYGDAHRRVIFASSEGAYIEQSRIDATARIYAVARDGAEVQQAGVSLGAVGDFGFVEGLHDEVREIGRRAAALLAAPQAPGGEHTVVLDPILAGVFIHEAFGHLSEADFIYENQKLREVMVLGRRFGEPLLNVVDGAAIPGLRGSYRYDDEGVPATQTHLIRDGVLSGRLHSRETAGAMGEAATGNARAISYRFRPIVRMTNTMILPGAASFDDLIADIAEGIYAKDWFGGSTSMEMFTFSAAEAYMIRHGRLAEPLRGLVLSGNVFETLAQIDGVGNDPAVNQGGGCGKYGQYPLPIANGSPHIRIRRCLVGGR